MSRPFSPTAGPPRIPSFPSARTAINLTRIRLPPARRTVVKTSISIAISISISVRPTSPQAPIPSCSKTKPSDLISNLRWSKINSLLEVFNNEKHLWFWWKFVCYPIKIWLCSRSWNNSWSIAANKNSNNKQKRFPSSSYQSQQWFGNFVLSKDYSNLERSIALTKKEFRKEIEQNFNFVACFNRLIQFAESFSRSGARRAYTSCGQWA